MFNGQFKSVLNKITVEKNPNWKPSRHSTKALPTYRLFMIIAHTSLPYLSDNTVNKL